jgi:pimeloyl-CoA synthetase
MKLTNKNILRWNTRTDFVNLKIIKYKDKITSISNDTVPYKYFNILKSNFLSNKFVAYGTVRKDATLLY